MRSRERSEALVLTLAGPGEEQEQLAALAPSSGASRHLLPLRRRRAAASRDDGWASVSGFHSPNKTKPRIAGLRQVHACAPIHIPSGDRKSVVAGKGVSVRLDLGGRRHIK